ncbi:hypothetical protein [Tenacibaculum sp. M341]|uniref:hypothetical protein n=1 Tax=Tenacibaculum sp. M341 TaxID=2530339 RepID=UPI00104D2BBB|nr:hypothetical protein [Tenacibaculum sp. M341]TCI92323.1 hypothetical protein EYW44_09075 [Tenacibaculum sp. M341]
MKKYVIVTIAMFVCGSVLAQNKPKTEKAKDSIIKTEEVNVVTSYAPKVTDAYKIKRKPIIKLSKNVERKTLDYQIQSIPVASTFIPKSGVLKGIDLGDRERLFNNYISAGFGNNTTPFLEAYFHNSNAFEYEYGGKVHFISSSDPVQNTELSSSYYNASIDLFLKQEMRYFDWKLGAKASRDKYNWYGLPDNIVFLDPTINRIEEGQTYEYYNIFGSVFLPSNISEVNGSVALFRDALDTSEIHADIDAKMSFPLGRFGLNSEDFELVTSINFLNGGFDRSYNDPLQDVAYSFVTGGVKPSYAFQFKNIDFKVGAKAYYSFNLEASEGKFFIYPDAEVNYAIIPRYANIYGGVTGDLTVNSFKSLTDQNPYLSPTLTLTQTSEALNVYGGFRGILSGNLNYNARVSYKREESKPLFLLNQSLSNGINTSFPANGISFKGYQYGNSFNVVYDDVNTVSFEGEVSYDFSRKLNLGLNIGFNAFDLSTQEHAWNLPQLTADVFGTYKVKKWYAGANLYFIGSRKGINYDVIANTSSVVDLNSYIDLNLNGGYHINDLFSVFLKANNITNSNYQTFTNFNAQGFQVLGGIIYKFDTFF